MNNEQYLYKEYYSGEVRQKIVVYLWFITIITVEKVPFDGSKYSIRIYNPLICFAVFILLI